MTLEDQLRALHAPVEHYDKLECDGCDYESNYEGEPPQWPCRSAELVYTDEEIADWTETFKSWRKWGRERERRKNLASGWCFSDEMNIMMRGMVQATLTRMPLFDKLAGVTTKSGTVVIPISRSMAEMDPE